MRVDRLDVGAYTVPTDAPESDGTLSWSETTAVVVEATAGATTGIGYSYAAEAAAAVARDVLCDVVVGRDAMDVPGIAAAMARRVRNVGRPGIAAHAIAAVDSALWDLKARLLDLPLARLLGLVREEVPVYASGGFTSLWDDELREQLGGWVHDDGIPRVKMKIGTGWGTERGRDLERVRAAREAIGPEAELFVDANGAYTVKQAVSLARPLADAGVTWFEEPVSSDDLAGLRTVREMTDVDVAAGEYGYDVWYFERMASAAAVDVLQVDATRCMGISELLRAAAVGGAHHLEISSHTAQSLHAHPACAIPNLRHAEYFADHARVERLLFDGVLEPTRGALRPDLSRPGMGLELKRPDAERYRRG